MTAPVEEARGGLRAWAAVALLLVLSLFSVLDRNLITLLVDPIKADMHVSDVQLSLLFGMAFATFYGLSGIIAGYAVDRFSRRIVLAVGVLVWSLGTMLTALTDRFSLLFIARASVGAGEAVLPPATYSILSDMFSRGRLALPVSITALGLKLGQGFALVVGGVLTALIPPSLPVTVPLLGEMQGWRAIFLLGGAPGLLLILLILLMREPTRHGAVQAAGSDAGFARYLSFMRQERRFFLCHHLGQFLFVSVSIGVTAWTPAFMTRVHGWSPAETGTWIGLASLIGAAVGMPLHGWIADRMYRASAGDGHMRYAMWSAALAAPVAIAAFLVPAAWVAAVLIGLLMLVMSSYASLPLVALQTVVPATMRGKSVSVVMLVAGTGALVVGPFLVAVLTDGVFGDPAAVGMALALCGGALLPLVALLFGLSLSPLRRMAAQA